MAQFQTLLNIVKGKTIALVYIFEKEDSPGFKHFLVWKDKILIGWLKAIYELNCLPYIMDVRTFLQKASNHSLPHIDYVVNLNSGCYTLSTMGLVPAICSFLDIPCIPCDAAAILSAENKKISNFVAKGLGLYTPNTLNGSSKVGIYRPNNLGNSIGIKIGSNTENGQTSGMFQEFIPGYDITIPFAFNPELKDIDVFPPILYLPNSLDPYWIFDEESKKEDTGLRTVSFRSIEQSAREQLLSLIKTFDIKTFGRIDARIKTADTQLTDRIADGSFDLENTYFIEINAMPTVEKGDGLDLAFKEAQNKETNRFHRCVSHYISTIPQPTINGFLLFVSILAFSTSKY